MPTKMYLEHTFNTTAEDLFQKLSDETFDAELMVAIGMGREIIETKEEGTTRFWKLRMSPSTDDLPSFMKKVVKGNNDYIEHRTWDDATLGNTWIIEPTFAAGKVDINGILKVIPAGEGKCKRILEGSFHVKVPLIGSKIEKFIISQTEDSFAKGAKFIESKLAE